ncbi:MAG: ABC transporter permease [Gemmatimonadales bacterium]|nr:MAG: ABC transporter permease [Gemmatimonadales bacterium]
MIERLMLIVRMALRNLRRQLRRSLLTASAMVLGIGLLMFIRALEGGAHLMYVETATRMGTGHIAMEHPDYMGSQDLADRIAAADLERAFRAVEETARPEELLAVFPQVNVGGLAQSASSSIPVRIGGVDPELERDVSFLADRVVEGRYLQPGDRLEGIVGVGVAERLRLELGSRLVLMAAGAGGDLESQLVLVTGIFRTGVPEVDRGVVQLPISTAREWLGLGDDATSMSVILASDDRTGSIADAVRERLRDEGVDADRIAVRPWWEAMPDLHAGLRADAVQTYVMLVILLGIVALAVVNSVLMAVLNRTREFGVMRALGLNRASVGAMVMVEGVILTFASGLLGMLLGLVISMGLFRDGVDISWLFGGDLAFAGAIVDPVITPAVLTVDVVAILSIVMTIGILASLYPAWHATRIEPAEAMKTDA